MDIIDRKIWWLASYPKSGNTWVRMFLNAYTTGFPLEINSAFQFVMGDIYPEGMQMLCPRPLSTLNTAQQYMYHTGMLLNLLLYGPSRDVCLKTHNAKCRVEDIPTIPPAISRGAIYVIRDPRDVVVSVSHHFDLTIDKAIEFMNNKKQGAQHKDTNLVHILLTWSLNVLTWTEKNKDVPVTIIRYEDLLDDPETNFRKILENFGIKKVREERFKFALEESTFERLRGYEDKHGFREKAHGEKFFRVGKKGQWKDILTEEQVQKIEEDHGEIMEKHGYKLVSKVNV